jgi:hypothetical protein
MSSGKSTTISQLRAVFVSAVKAQSIPEVLQPHDVETLALHLFDKACIEVLLGPVKQVSKAQPQAASKPNGKPAKKRSASQAMKEAWKRRKAKAAAEREQEQGGEEEEVPF